MALGDMIEANVERCFAFLLLLLEFSYLMKKTEIAFYILEKGGLVINQKCEAIWNQGAPSQPNNLLQWYE